MERAGKADFALVGIGDARDDSAVVRMGCFSVEEMARLRQARAVGDILGYFFDVEGAPVADGMESRVVGLAVEDLRRIPCTLAMASEAGKATAILGALRTGIVDVLATSIANAQSVLALEAAGRPG